LDFGTKRLQVQILSLRPKNRLKSADFRRFFMRIMQKIVPGDFKYNTNTTIEKGQNAATTTGTRNCKNGMLDIALCASLTHFWSWSHGSSSSGTG
jgi:hypothetical protein